MCSSCGGGKAAARLPGATPGNPIVFGEANGATAQPATFLVNHSRVMAGQYKYVSGDGVDQAVADAIIQIGYGKTTAVTNAAPVTVPSPRYYVKTGNNRWVGFKSKASADRYAATVGGVSMTREEVLRSKKSGSGEQ